MIIGHGPFYWLLILFLCIGGAIFAWNTITWDPSTLVQRPVPLSRYLFTFGDSFTTTGFDITSPDYPTMFQPLGNPPFPGETSSGGLNWVGFMLRDLAPEATLVFNLARSGATINTTLVPTIVGTGHDLSYQVKQFQDHLKIHPPEAPWKRENSAVVAWMGINDVTLSYAHNVVGLSQDWEELRDDIVESYIRCFDALHIAGVRNFILLNLPPINLNPRFQQGDEAVSEHVGKDIASFNAKLRTRFQRWKGAHPLSNFRIVDTHPAFKQPLESPETYGARDSTCVDADGERCLWTDPFHPGQAIQKLVAQRIYNSLDTFGFWRQALY